MVSLRVFMTTSCCATIVYISSLNISRVERKTSVSQMVVFPQT